MTITNMLLNTEALIIVSQLSSNNLFITKVYEQDHFLHNPDPALNQNQIAEYLSCPKCFPQRVKEIREMFIGWARINREETIKLIGIHNQDPKILFIQFSHGLRYFVYRRDLEVFRETVLEELFSKKDRFRLRPLNQKDQEYLITNLKFNDKAKKAISFYPQKRLGYSLVKRSRKPLFCS
ncbi:hypothetical protein ACPUYX_15490 [Desulfosporosinus sp. SYSU MS00001]|uniref:hypothetical protein n=1 Tax=Desulfosporosinus sp. SYSU MS00001 TaxID=3416284 RepID=UPI003CED58E5